MTGRMTAAAAFACLLLGLAACGGGGGGGGGGTGAPGGGMGDPGGGMGDPGGGMTTMEPWSLDLEDAAAEVVTINTAVTAAPTSNHQDATNFFSAYRNVDGDLIIYNYNTVDPDSPIVTSGTPGEASSFKSLEPYHLGGNAWRFTTDAYTSGGTEYVGTLLFFVGPDDYVDYANGDFNYWGVWIRQTTADDGTVTWDKARSFNRFAGDISGLGRTYSLSHLGSLTGTATYSGEANGLYTKGNAAGWFRADASLEVKFGGNDIDTAERFTVTGTIDNFDLSGNETTDWTVALTGAYPRNSSNLPSNVGWEGTANGSGAAGRVFQVRAYGETLTEHPTVMTGQFKAFFSDGSVIGGLHATLDE